MGQIIRAAGLYSSEGLKEFRRLDFADGAFSQQRKNIVFQMSLYSSGMIWCLRMQLLAMPFAGNSFKRVFSCELLPQVCSLALCGRVKISMQLLA
jgi:hypothetical protein